MGLSEDEDYSAQIKTGIVEQYWVQGQHFTRSIGVSPTGRFCPQVFAIDGVEIPSEEIWLLRLQQARNLSR